MLVLVRLITVAGFAALALFTAGCAPVGETSGGPSEKAKVDVYEAKVVKGEVVSHDDVNLVVDYGGEFLALAELALITSDEYCASNYRQLSRWVKKQAPIGSMVWLDTSRPTQDKGEWIEDPAGGGEEIVVGYVPAFVYLDKNDDKLPTDRMTLNEMAIRAGEAVPEPPSWYPKEIDVGVAMSTKRARRELSDHDFGYWLTINEAWMESWKAERGPFGECRAEVVAIQERNRELEAEWEREEREFDRWYADLKRRSGQGGGTRSCDGDGDGICNE